MEGSNNSETHRLTAALSVMSDRIRQLEQQLQQSQMTQSRVSSASDLAPAADNTSSASSTSRPHFFRPPLLIDSPAQTYSTLLYRVDPEERIAHITLNRPDRMNAIVWPMPYEIRHAVQRANADDRVHAIVVRGSGKGFCAGYDLKEFAEAERGTVAGSQRMPWDPFIDYQEMKECTECYMSLWKSYKPTIAVVHGWAVAGGSDIALCCDLVLMAEDAKIGYPPARVWGSPTTHHWTFRLGAERAKRMLLTGDLVSGVEAERMGLVLKAVPKAELDSECLRITRRMRGIPQNQLFFNKLICNQVAEGCSMEHAQSLATMLDGMTRHSPEGVAFQSMAQKHGFQHAIDAIRGDPTEGRDRFQAQSKQSRNEIRSKL